MMENLQTVTCQCAICIDRILAAKNVANGRNSNSQTVLTPQNVCLQVNQLKKHLKTTKSLNNKRLKTLKPSCSANSDFCERLLLQTAHQTCTENIPSVDAPLGEELVEPQVPLREVFSLSVIIIIFNYF